MDWDTVLENAPLVGTIIALILLQLFLRKRKPAMSEQEIVRNLLTEVRLDWALAEAFHQGHKPKKLETVSWQRSKGKLEFLKQSLQNSLTDAYTMAEDFNQRVASAKKYKSDSYMIGVNAERLKEPLVKSKQGLEEWLMANAGTKDPDTKYPGLLDGLFGEKR